MGIAKPRLALKDFKLMAAKEPGNKDARHKVVECEKIVRRIQFEKAIESDAPPSAWEGWEPEDLGSRCIDITDVQGWMKVMMGVN
jgi:serine/threonine-protein phosphatase 5